MNRHKSLALAVALGVLACEGSPSAPGRSGFGSRPMFHLGPGASADSIGCGTEQSYVFSSHFNGSNNHATFYPAGSPTARTQCGALAFDESGVGTVNLDYTLAASSDYQLWVRVLRTTGGDTISDTVFQGVRTDNPVHMTLNVPAQGDYDLVSFYFEHATTKANLHNEVEAALQLWREISPPTNLVGSLVNGNQPRITWTNHHLGRAFDSTEIFRFDGSVWDDIAIVGPTTTQFTDAAKGVGIYKYFVRHVTGHTYPETDAPKLARPNSPTTSSVSVAVGVVAPSGLSATAVSATQINLAWTDNAINETGFQVWRSVGGGAFSLRATKSAGATSHQDTGLLPETIYSYKVRAFNATDTSAYSNTASDTTPAAPPLVVDIDGPGVVRPGATCTWFAVVSGGVTPYSLQWSGVASGTDWSTTATIPSKSFVNLSVTDAVGGEEGASLVVLTNSGAPICDN